MIIGALVSLLALSILLPVSTRGDLAFVIDMEEFTAIAFLALVLHPVDAHRALNL